MRKVCWQSDGVSVDFLGSLGLHTGPRKQPGGQGSQFLGGSWCGQPLPPGPHGRRLSLPGVGRCTSEWKTAGWHFIRRGCWAQRLAPRGLPGFGGPGSAVQMCLTLWMPACPLPGLGQGRVAPWKGRVASRAFWELSWAGLGRQGQTAHTLAFSHPAVTSPALWDPSFSLFSHNHHF